MRLSGMVTNLILFGLLSALDEDKRKTIANRVDQLYQHGSSGDGAFDTAVRRAFNKEVEEAASIIQNPFLLVRD